MGHTKGKWKIGNNFDIPRERYVPEYTVVTDEKSVCTIRFTSIGYSPNEEVASERKAEAEANANLIAAAPDMLEALKTILTIHRGDLTGIAKGLAESAIRKATVTKQKA